MNNSTDITRLDISASSKLAIAYLKFHTSQNKSSSFFDTKNIISAASCEEDIEYMYEHLFKLLFQAASNGISEANIAFSGGDEFEPSLHPELDDILYSNEFILIANEKRDNANNKNKRRMSVEIYGKKQAWASMVSKDSKNKGRNVTEQKIIELLFDEFEMIKVKNIFGHNFINLIWIPDNFNLVSVNHESIIEALSVGVPFSDVFA